MNQFTAGKIITAIDIGTTKICVIMGRVNAYGKCEIVGMGQYPSHGLKRGVVVNIQMTVDSIKKAIAEAEKLSGLSVTKAIVGISGGHIQSFNTTGVVAIKSRDVSQEDIDRVIEVAKAIPIPQDREILHVIPQYFRVDGQELVLDSLGMYGVRLEAHVHIVTGAISSAQNIIKSCELAGVIVEDIVLEQIASAEAVLTKSERELGVGILDIGGGTSDFALYKDSRVRHSKVIPCAGNHFTSDLAIGLQVPIKTAEEIKKSYGFVFEEKYFEYFQEKFSVNIEDLDQKKEFDLYGIYEILNPRAAEILELLKEELETYRLMPLMPSGLVLTGGGALLNGMKELSQEIFALPVRVGRPFSNQEGGIIEVPDVLKSPVYATAFGLLLYAAQSTTTHFGSTAHDTLFTRVAKKMKSWVYDLF